MRKFNLFAIFAFIASLVLFTSCGEEEEDLAPEIKIAGESIETGEDANVGDSVLVSWTLIPGDNKLAEFTVTYDNKIVYEAEDLGDATVSGKVKIYAASANQAAKVTLKAVDKKDIVTIEEIVFVIKDAPVALTEKGTVTLGAGGNSAGSYYSLEGGVYTLTQAKANVAKLTFVYNYTATDNAQIYSPSESTNADLSGAPVTQFVKVTGVDFASATSADLESVTPNSNKLTSLAVGDVIAFKDAAGKMGLIKIDNLVENTDGTATVSISVR